MQEETADARTGAGGQVETCERWDRRAGRDAKPPRPCIWPSRAKRRRERQRSDDCAKREEATTSNGRAFAASAASVRRRVRAAQPGCSGLAAAAAPRPVRSTRQPAAKRMRALRLGDRYEHPLVSPQVPQVKHEPERRVTEPQRRQQGASPDTGWVDGPLSSFQMSTAARSCRSVSERLTL